MWGFVDCWWDKSRRFQNSKNWLNSVDFLKELKNQRGTRYNLISVIRRTQENPALT